MTIDEIYSDLLRVKHNTLNIDELIDKIHAEKEKKLTPWVLVNERQPEKEGAYLIVIMSFGGATYISIANYSLNLHKTDEFDFRNDKGAGWYKYDGEFGYYKIDDVIAWQPLPKYRQEEKGR